MNTPQSVANPKRTSFKIHLERAGTVLIHCQAGTDHAETGVRGLLGLVQRGWMSPPRELHVDPLLEHVDVDGIRYPCNAAGMQQLEDALNARYSMPVAEDTGAIHVTENAGSPTGFDLHYVTERFSVRQEINGHLGPDELDRLQDPSRCDLIRTDTVIRMHPPYLVVRRKHPGGTESEIPGLPDLEYRHATAAAVQRLLNHPEVARRGVTSGEPFAMPAPVATPVPSPTSAASSTVPTPAGSSSGSSAGAAKPESFLPKLRLADPPKPVKVEPPPEPPLPPEVQALFPSRDPGTIHRGIFEALCADVDFPSDDVVLTLPRAFEGRHFHVLNFDQVAIDGIMDLRSEEFRGFYLTELQQHGADLVYACRGLHLEWCADEAVLQPGLRQEPIEFKGTALLGLAQDAQSNFVFLVQPAYAEWIRPHAALCESANARFLTLLEWVAVRDQMTLIWPLP